MHFILQILNKNVTQHAPLTYFLNPADSLQTQFIIQENRKPQVWFNQTVKSEIPLLMEIHTSVTNSFLYALESTQIQFCTFLSFKNDLVCLMNFSCPPTPPPQKQQPKSNNKKGGWGGGGNRGRQRMKESQRLWGKLTHDYVPQRILPERGQAALFLWGPQYTTCPETFHTHWGPLSLSHTQASKPLPSIHHGPLWKGSSSFLCITDLNTRGYSSVPVWLFRLNNNENFECITFQ